VEAVAANAVFFIPLVREGIDVGFRLELRVEGGVEYACLRSAGHKSHTSGNALECGRTVERIDGYDRFDILDFLFAEKAGFVELTAVSESVSYCADLADVSDNTVFSICEKLEDESNSLVVGRHGVVCFIVFLAGTLMGDCTAKADLFTKTLCKHLAAFHIKELIFERAASGIDYQNFHVSCPFLSLHLVKRTIAVGVDQIVCKRLSEGAKNKHFGAKHSSKYIISKKFKNCNRLNKKAIAE
jgi:hypothetical protein